MEIENLFRKKLFRHLKWENKCFRMITSHLKSEMKPYPDRIDIQFGIGYLIS